MSSQQSSRKRARSGELRKIDCRVCQSTINFQSYKDHLTAKHPQENSRDLRGHGQAVLFFRGRGGAAAAAAVPIPGGHETDIGDGEGEGVPGDLLSQDVDDVDHQVKDTVSDRDTVTNELDVELEDSQSQDVIPNTGDSDDVMKDISDLDDITMEEDIDIEGESETVTVARLKRERDELLNLVFYVNKKLTDITDKYVKNLYIDESETEKGEVLIRVKAIQKYLEVEEKMKSLTEALKELESVSGKDKCDKVNLVKKEKQEDVNHILLEARSMKEITKKVYELKISAENHLSPLPSSLPP